jgi:membrane protein YqaA with SNARE-associated domain
MDAWLQSLLSLLALPEYGLGTLFVISFLSATLLPMGSEPALFGLVKLNPDLLGGMLDWWLGYGAHQAVDKWKDSPVHVRALDWLERLGPKACLLSWLPLVGDPLCAVAGWLRMPLWPCAMYMLVGKLVRYVVMTLGLLFVFPGAIPGFTP